MRCHFLHLLLIGESQMMHFLRFHVICTSSFDSPSILDLDSSLIRCVLRWISFCEHPIYLWLGMDETRIAISEALNRFPYSNKKDHSQRVVFSIGYEMMLLI